MIENKPDTPSTWVDPDDAPELTDEWFQQADQFDAGVLVKRGRPALAAPKNSMVEIAGPERLKLSSLIAHFLKASADPRHVVADPQARYFGLVLNDTSLVPGAAAHIGTTHFEDWIAQNSAARVGSPA